jgi:hypothetical protein
MPNKCCPQLKIANWTISVRPIASPSGHCPALTRQVGQQEFAHRGAVGRETRARVQGSPATAHFEVNLLSAFCGGLDTYAPGFGRDAQ